MTLLFAPARPAFAARIAAAFTLHPILRRYSAQVLYAEMLLLDDSLSAAADWRELSRLLGECELDLLMAPMQPGSLERAALFGQRSGEAHNRAVLMRVRIERDALRRGKRAPRVIEAKCTEVR